MSEMRNDEAGNHVEFEVSRLDDDATGATMSSSDSIGEVPPSRDNAQDGAQITAENSLRSRRRLLQASVTGLAVALAVAIILATFPDAASQLKAPLRLLTPEPTATVPLGSDIVLLAYTVPWGELRIDGRTDVAHDLGAANGYHAYRLPPGQHTLDYIAEPFPAVHCVVSAPSRASDTCGPPKNPDAIGEALRALDMNATVATMDNRERAKLQTLLERGASYPAITIEPGMHYLDQNGNPAIARERMVVTMSVGAVQPAPESAFNENGQQCGEFCSVSQQDDPAAWNLMINIEQRWMYVGANGATFAVYSPSETGFTGAQVTWINGEWALTSDLTFGNACPSPGQLGRISLEATGGGFYDGAWYADPTSANGCVMEFQPQDSATAQSPAQVLLRLGVALAANAEAQRLFTDLPVANAAERAIAQAIRAGQG
jgi:hypothetical protein